jgi:hypothetical protein
VIDSLLRELADFDTFGAKTRVHSRGDVPIFVNEFWTSKQRAAHSLHEVSYRACFKPQLPRFFITRLTREGELVYDPFMGRGTTLLEAALLGRKWVGCDINPLSKILLVPRLNPPTLSQVEKRLGEILFEQHVDTPDSLRVFYHSRTLNQICALREHLRSHNDEIDAWIRMVATNRLTGHSPGFFSVYTLPPNQAVTVERQARINRLRKQKPDFRDVPKLILSKSKSLLNKLTDEDRALLIHSSNNHLFTQSSDHTPHIQNNSVSLVVTSPPFLDVVDYATDNWLRCWFNDIDAKAIPIWSVRNVNEWQLKMTDVFRELHRVLKRCGFVAFEVGEVRGGKVKLEEVVIEAGSAAGLSPALVLINDQSFTKTSNIWGVSNLQKGTNTNRVVVFQKT